MNIEIKIKNLKKKNTILFEVPGYVLCTQLCSSNGVFVLCTTTYLYNICSRFDVVLLRHQRYLRFVEVIKLRHFAKAFFIHGGK